MAKATTFVIPLKAKRTDFSIRGFLSPEGMTEVAKTYREKCNGPWYPVTRDEPSKPLVFCTAHAQCAAVYDPNKGEWRGACVGSCGE